MCSSIARSCPETRSFTSTHCRSSKHLKGSQLLNSINKRNPVGQAFSSAGVYTYVESEPESLTRGVEEKVGVLLLNLGGPETLHDVQPFLFNLFADPVCYSNLFYFAHLSTNMTKSQVASSKCFLLMSSML